MCAARLRGVLADEVLELPFGQYILASAAELPDLDTWADRAAREGALLLEYDAYTPSESAAVALLSLAGGAWWRLAHGKVPSGGVAAATANGHGFVALIDTNAIITPCDGAPYELGALVRDAEGWTAIASEGDLRLSVHPLVVEPPRDWVWAQGRVQYGQELRVEVDATDEALHAFLAEHRPLPRERDAAQPARYVVRDDPANSWIEVRPGRVSWFRSYSSVSDAVAQVDAGLVRALCEMGWRIGSWCIIEWDYFVLLGAGQGAPSLRDYVDPRRDPAAVLAAVQAALAPRTIDAQAARTLDEALGIVSAALGGPASRAVAPDAFAAWVAAAAGLPLTLDVLVAPGSETRAALVALFQACWPAAVLPSVTEVFPGAVSGLLTRQSRLVRG